MRARRLARVVIIRARQLEVAENPPPRDRFAPLAALSSFGLIGLVDAFDGLLQELTLPG